MESFFTAAAILLWIIIGIMGIVSAIGIFMSIGYGFLLLAAKIKRASRRHKFNKQIHMEGENTDNGN